MHYRGFCESVSLQRFVQTFPISVVPAHIHHQVAEQDTLWNEDILWVVAFGKFVDHVDEVTRLILPFYLCHLEGLEEQSEIEEVAWPEDPNRSTSPGPEKRGFI